MSWSRSAGIRVGWSAVALVGSLVLGVLILVRGLAGPGAADPGEIASSRGVPLAVLDGEGVYLEDFRAFVQTVRGPRYEPATEVEANRLLRSQLRARLLDREAARRGYSVDADGRRAALAELAAEAGAPIVVSDQDVERYRRRQREALRLDAPADEPADRVRARLRARRIEVQRTALLEQLLERAALTVDADRLASVAVSREDSLRAGGEPPRPPVAALGASL